MSVEDFVDQVTAPDGQTLRFLDMFYVKAWGKVREYRCTGIGPLDGQMLVYGGTAFRFPLEYCYTTREGAEANVPIHA